MMSKEILVPKGRDIVCFRACDNSLKRALMLRRIGVCLGKVSTTEASSVSMSSRTEPDLNALMESINLNQRDQRFHSRTHGFSTE
jgi:hypothetical protein